MVSWIYASTEMEALMALNGVITLNDLTFYVALTWLYKWLR